jgi:hypothetical protein
VYLAQKSYLCMVDLYFLLCYNYLTMKSELPQSVKVCLWSYDADKIDFSIPGHRQIAFINILNIGTKEAVEWLLGNFTKKEIAEVIKKSYTSEWNHKSLAFWSTFFHASPLRKNRFNTFHETALAYSR